MNKKTLHYQCKIIHPKDYNWKQTFGEVARSLSIHHQEYLNINSEKLMGLCHYIEELEHEIEYLRKKLHEINKPVS